MDTFGDIDRRSVLVGASATIGAALVAGASPVSAASSGDRGGRIVEPFTLGVASGDPLPRAVVIWTRLAPRPLDLDGGMPTRAVPVRWEVAADEHFRRVVRRGVSFARPELGHSVHVDVRGLDPHTWYWYRFRTGRDLSAVGRTRTAPRPDADVPVTFAFASCAQLPTGFFTAYRHLADEGVDAVFHLGDYFYEYGGSGNGSDRAHVGPEISTLGDYRRRYAQYKTDGDLQAAHAAAPWIVTWDDHEVDNNYAGVNPSNDDPAQGNGTPESFAARRAAAYQAYWENMPLRTSRRPSGASLPLHRRLQFGRTADFSVLDTRQYRTDQPCGDTIGVSCGEENDPDATILGDEQASWLEQGLAASTSTWNIVPQQIFLASLDIVPGPPSGGYNDGWDGYRASRNRLLGFVESQSVENFVVLTGDIHISWMSDLRADFEDETRPVIGTEFVCTSITSGGDGADGPGFLPALQAENPHLRYFNNLRGYTRCTVDRTECRADYRVVDRVSTPGAPVRTHRSFVIEAGVPGAVDA